MSEFGAPQPHHNLTNTTAYAAALQRARQIAAKINPSAAETTGKRELEDGSQPGAKKLAVEEGAHGISGRAGPVVAAMGYGGDSSTEEITVPDRIVGLIIGRGGEQITRLQAESGCKIQMERSRGTSERTCTLTGNREAISRAKEMVMNLVTSLSRNDSFGGGPPGADDFQGGGGGPGPGGPGGPGGPPGSFFEMMVPTPKVGLIIGKGGETIKHLQDTSGCKMVVVQDPSTPDHEKPLRISGNPQQVEHAKDLVYQLLQDKESGRRMGGGGGGGGGFGGPPNNFNNDFGGGGGGGFGGPNGPIIEILVPRAAVGVVIGKGGEMIKKIQAETGCKLQFEQGRDDGPGDRKCILQGKPQQCEEARERVEELIESVQRRDGDNGGGRDRRGGPGGGRDRGNGFDGRGGGGGGRWGGGGGGRTEITFAVPANRAGFVIGRGGETIKQINAQSGAHCEIDRKQPNMNTPERIFTIRGTPDQIEEAKRLIIEKSGIEDFGGPGGPMGGGPGGPMGGQMGGPMGPNSTAYPNQGGYGPGGGGGGGGWGGPGPGGFNQWGGAPEQQQQPSGPAVGPASSPAQGPGGQPDYTLQWAEYYRSMGMMREAEMIEANAKNKPAGGVPVAGVAPGVGAAGTGGAAPAAQSNGSQPDYSAQWADYYRSLGKIKEAEAVEAQMKAKQAGVAASVSPQQPMMAGQGQQGGQYGQYGGYQQPQGNPNAYYGGPGGQPQHPSQYNYPGPYGGAPGGGYGQQPS